VDDVLASGVVEHVHGDRAPARDAQTRAGDLSVVSQGPHDPPGRDLVAKLADPQREISGAGELGGGLRRVPGPRAAVLSGGGRLDARRASQRQPLAARQAPTTHARFVGCSQMRLLLDRLQEVGERLDPQADQIRLERPKQRPQIGMSRDPWAATSSAPSMYRITRTAGTRRRSWR
jgi:hypothetical protein